MKKKNCSTNASLKSEETTDEGEENSENDSEQKFRNLIKEGVIKTPSGHVYLLLKFTILH